MSCKIHCGVCRDSKAVLLTTLLFLLLESTTTIKIIVVIYNLPQWHTEHGVAFFTCFSPNSFVGGFGLWGFLVWFFVCWFFCEFGGFFSGVFAFEMVLRRITDSLHWIYKFCLARSVQFGKQKFYSCFAHCLSAMIIVPKKYTA